MLNKSIKFLIENKLVAVLLLALFVGWGVVNAPFNWETGFLPTDPVAVDAIMARPSKLLLPSGKGVRHRILKTKSHIRLPLPFLVFQA